MLIGIDASRANHDQRTGVEEYAYSVIQELKKITPDNVRVVLYTDRSLQGELAKLPVNWSEKVLHWLPKRLWTQIRLSLEMFLNPPDILFIPAHVFPIIHPQKTVMTIHDIAAIKFSKSYNWFERRYTLWSSKYAVRKLWQVLVPSEFTKQELISNFQISPATAGSRLHSGTISNKISVISHGYDKRYQKIENKTKIEEVLKKYSIKQPFLLSVGRLEEKKNTVRIVEAFNLLKVRNPKSEVQLVLVGKPGYGYEKVKQAIEVSPFRSDIITPGWVAEDDLPYLMSGAEVFVFPSLYEGFGLPVLEALSCGCPVVASKGSSLEEVGGNACLCVDSENIEEIKEAIMKLLQNTECRMQNIAKGLERVKEFSWEKCARETLKQLTI